MKTLLKPSLNKDFARSITQTVFRTGQVCDLAGVSSASLQTWLARRLVNGQDSIGGGGGFGIHRLWTFYNVVEVAAAKALIDAGMSDLRSVFRAAGMFAHTDCVMSGEPARKVGLPIFPGVGATVIAAAPDRAEVVFLEAESTVGGRGLCEKLIGQPTGVFAEPFGCVIVNMSRVFDRLALDLGLPPQEALAAEYA